MNALKWMAKSILKTLFWFSLVVVVIAIIIIASSGG